MMDRQLRRLGGIFLLIFFTFSASHPTFSQGYYDFNWYFGNSNSGLIFNKFDTVPQLVNDQALAYGLGSSAVVSDPLNGSLLFYSDGNGLFNTAHLSMGVNLQGNDAANQQIAVSPVPGMVDQYFIFTNVAGTIESTIVENPAVLPALGTVINENTPTAIGGISDPIMVINNNANPREYWLLAQVGNQLNLYGIDASGVVLTPVLQTNITVDAAHFAYHFDTNKLAVAPKGTNENVQLYDLNPTGGIFSLDLAVANSGGYDAGVTESIFDVEFSPDGSKLYISRQGGDISSPNGDVLQYNVAVPNNSLPSVLSGAVFRSYGLKRGPDGNIYHLYQENSAIDPFLLGRLSQADSTFDLTIYESGLFLNNDFNGRQFPEFAFPQQRPFDVPDFMVNSSCDDPTMALTEVPVSFYAQVEPAPDSCRWSFGDGSSNDLAPIHTYAAAGTYDVQLTVFYGGVPETSLAQQITVTDPTEMPDLGADTTICRNEVLTLDPGIQGATSIGWSTGETTPTIDVDSAGYYWVAVEVGGCKMYDAIQVDICGDTVQIANFWYFGDNAGIDFNEQPPIPLNDGAQTAPEGVATVSDLNGDLLFYTDGQTVYNREHTQMLNGDNIGGSPDATQSSIIVQFPDDETQYYIFTTDDAFGDASNDMRMAVVDIKGDAGNGEVVIKDKPVFSKSTERVTANANWVIGHEFGNNTFRAYPVGTNGIGKPVLSSVGSVHSLGDERNAKGYMKLSPNDSLLAVALPGSQNFVEIFSFDDSLGAFSNPMRIDLEVNGGQGMVYGIEFSSDNQKLYASVDGLGGDVSRLFQMELDTLTQQAIQDTKRQFYEDTDASVRFGALQMSPAGQIYTAIEGSDFLGVITNPSAEFGMLTFQPNGFALVPGAPSRLGLPNFIQNQSQPPEQRGFSFSPVPTCVDQEVTFEAQSGCQLDMFSWRILNASNGVVASGSGGALAHTFATAGSYTAELTITNRCGLLETQTQNVVVSDVPADPELPDAVSFCTPNESISLTPANLDIDYVNGETFSWTDANGQVLVTDATVNITLPGDYTFTVTNTSGCTSSKTVTLADGRFPINLGPDLNVCQNDPLPDFDSGVAHGVGGNTVDWRILETGETSTGRTRAISTALAGTFSYEVTVTDGLNMCTAIDTAVILVNPTPVVTVDPMADPPTCGNMDGSLTATVNPAGSYNFFWTDSQGTVVSTTFDAIGLGAGLYTLVVTNSVTGCNATETYALNDDGPFMLTLDATSPDNCEGTGGGDFTVTLSGASVPANYDYIILDDMGGQVETGASNSATLTVPVPASLIAGIYSIEITDSAPGGCTQSLTGIEILPPDSVTFETEPLVETCEPEVELSAINIDPVVQNPTFEWLNLNTSVVVGDQSSVTVTEGGLYQITVTDNNTDASARLCPSAQQVQVFMNAPPNVSLVESGESCLDGQVTLNVFVDGATPSGDFTIDWTRPTFADNVATQIITETGNYEVTVFNVATGCSVTTSLNVDVFEPIMANPVTSPLCEGQPFTLDAGTTRTDLNYAWTLNGSPVGGNTKLLENQTQAGTYEVVISDGAGVCSVNVTIPVALNPFNEADLATSFTICSLDPNNDQITLQPGNTGDFTSFQWLSGGTLVSSLSSFTITSAGNYTGIFTNGFGCPDVVNIIVTEDCTQTIHLPNAFSPNGNGRNDDFRVFGDPSVTDFEIFIFNRWGEIIYHSDNIDFRWDGIYKNELVPLGTYPYLVKYINQFDAGSGTVELRGGVTVLR